MSYISVYAPKVKGWCENTLNILDKSRKELTEERIQYYMKPTKFLGLTVDKGMTYDEAKKFVYSDSSAKSLDQAMEDDLCVYAHRVQYNKVRALLSLARAAIKENGPHSTVQVSQEDYNRLIIGK